MKIKQNLVCFLFYFMGNICLFAQGTDMDSLKIQVGLAITGIYQGGNVETRIFRAQTNFNVGVLESLMFKNQNSYIYQEFGGDKADEDILSLNFLEFNSSAKVYPFALGFISSNFRREISLRQLYGIGATLKILDKKDQKLKLSLSSEYEQTRFSTTDFNFDAYDGMESINTLRATIWINGQYAIFDNKMKLIHESYYQPSLEGSDNYRWQYDIGLEFPIWKWLQFRVSYRHTYESIVIADQQREDRFLTFGFSVKNY